MPDRAEHGIERAFRAAQIWREGRWQADDVLAVDRHGRIRAAGESMPVATRLNGLVLPGIANLHSHAFQRAMAGRAERRGPGADSFWTWRETMYALAARISPDSLHAIAAQLYLEMLEAGYTRVCEFHYLHHPTDGGSYAEPAAMSHALIAAAREVGIGLTLVPTLYQRGGFDDRELAPRQRRFHHRVDEFIRLVQDLRGLQDDNLRIGVAFHSLRAVSVEVMRRVLDALSDDVQMPVHLHIAEQTGEVDECLAVHGARPVRWLLHQFPVARTWTLVHATHLDAGEVAGLASSGATVALCPSTEGNLGDGFFPLQDYAAAAGRWGIGSDSHVSISPVEELRWLEYGQRLLLRARNVAASAASPSTGQSLLQACLDSASSASGVPSGDLVEAGRADFLILDEAMVEFAALPPEMRLDAWLLASQRPCVREVYVGGRQMVAEGRHPARDVIAARYRAHLQALFG